MAEEKKVRIGKAGGGGDSKLGLLITLLTEGESVEYDVLRSTLT